MELNKKKIKNQVIGLKCVACSAINVNPKPYKYTQDEKFISKIKLKGVENKTFKIK